MRIGVAALSIIVASASVLVIAIGMRRRVPPLFGDALVAAGGAGLGLGALFVQENVSGPAWLLTPALVGALAVVQVKVLLRGAGPLRK